MGEKVEREHQEERLDTGDHRESWESTQSIAHILTGEGIKMAKQKQTNKNFKEQTSFDLSVKCVFKILNSKIILDKKEHKYISALDPGSPKAAILHSCTQHGNLGTGPKA